MLNMNISQHASRRLQQRGIPEKMLPLLFAYGEEAYDHKYGLRTIYLNRHGRAYIARVTDPSEFKQMQAALDVYAVLDRDDCIVTIGHRTRRINRD
jgi:hypothetical protein